MKTIGLGFLGFGNIGSGVYRIITEYAQSMLHRHNIKLEIKKMLVRDVAKQRRFTLDSSIYTTNPDEVILRDDVDIIVEFMGGEEPARTYLLQALNAGKSVVTANKEVIAKCWHELEAAAKAHNVGVHFEASVAGGIPIIKTLTDSLQANDIDTVMGIINGTTNYILTAMAEQGMDYIDALRQAQELGLAEPDPTNDVEGYDAMYKLSILSSLAFHAKIPIEHIARQGITQLTAGDIAYGKDMGYTLKLLAVGKKEESTKTVQVRVHPTFIPNGHPLSSVRGSFNAVYLHGSAVGELMLYGRGAGDMPTGSAIVSDILTAAMGRHYYTTFENSAQSSAELHFEDDATNEFFVRANVLDRPGVMGKIASIFGEYQVSLRTVMQKEGDPDGHVVPVVFMTHMAKERALYNAIAKIEGLDVVVGNANIIHVESTF